MLELAIILPTLEERANIVPLVERLDAALAGISWEAIFVDDSSADGTAEVARDLGRSDPRIRVIQRIGRRGLASAAIEGACATAAPFVAVMDADHQHDPALLKTMLDKVLGGENDVCVASRFAEGGSSDGLADERRRQGSRLANRIARRVTGTELTDPMSGFFLMRTNDLRRLAPGLSGIGFKVLLDILATAPEPLRVAEVPLNFAPRRAGDSKLDRAVAFDFLVGLYDRIFGRLVPTRFAMFATVGGAGVLVHLAVLALFYPGVTATFWKAQSIATLAAMSFNFLLNNWLTYRDQRLTGMRALVAGWAGFCLTCSVGAFANVAVAGLLQAGGVFWMFAALAGIVVGAVWNYALSSKFVWGRF
ncbi:glycosyltransferase family 2 protein [Altererythrobacter sp.]|nr:glycosyltransferase family 2 protein [Altererythrobacter sp.]